MIKKMSQILCSNGRVQKLDPVGACLLAGALFTSAATADSWPGFRGFSQSHFDGPEPPLHWGAESGTAWTTKLPGTGQSSPVVWGDNVYVTTVEGANKETLYLLCFSLLSGEKKWARTWESSFPEKDSDYISKGAPTPAIDADRLYVLFESGDLFGLTHLGEEVWRRKLTEDYGKFEGNHGQAASPVLTGHGVVVLVDQQGQSFIASFDKASGETQWKTDRNTSTAWSSPVVIERDGGTEIVTSGSGLYAAYHAGNGKMIWSYEGLDGNNVPSPATDGSIFLVGSRKKGANLALKVEGEDVREAWVAEDATSAFGSPLIHAGRAYYVSDAGIIYCYRVKTGEPLWDARIDDSTWASPLGVDDRIYFFGKGGKTTVIAASDEFRIVAENQIEVDTKDRVYGYAAVDGKFIFRLGSRLICISSE
jgi:outer membrane protein assembly factor BamB